MLNLLKREREKENTSERRKKIVSEKIAKVSLFWTIAILDVCRWVDSLLVDDDH